jgi:hypothetical protein
MAANNKATMRPREQNPLYVKAIQGRALASQVRIVGAAALTINIPALAPARIAIFLEPEFITELRASDLQPNDF